MRRKSAETRKQILESAYTLFYRNGFVRTGVDAVAGSAGITKRTLYQHFTSKDELIGAVLDHQQKMAFDRIRQWGDSLSGKPEQMVMTLFEKLERWANEKGWQGSGFTRAALEFADLPGHPARKAARRQKKEVETYLAEKFACTGLDYADQLVREIMLLIEGCQTLTLIHGGRDYIEAARHAALTLLLRCQAEQRKVTSQPDAT